MLHHHLINRNRCSLLWPSNRPTGPKLDHASPFRSEMMTKALLIQWRWIACQSRWRGKLPGKHTSVAGLWASLSRWSETETFVSLWPQPTLTSSIITTQSSTPCCPIQNRLCQCFGKQKLANERGGLSKTTTGVLGSRQMLNHHPSGCALLSQMKSPSSITQTGGSCSWNPGVAKVSENNICQVFGVSNAIQPSNVVGQNFREHADSSFSQCRARTSWGFSCIQTHVFLSHLLLVTCPDTSWMSVLAHER